MTGIKREKISERTHEEELTIRQELVSRARALIPLLKKNAEETDKSRKIPQENMDCARRPNFDHPCRLNIDQGWKHISSEACCG